MVTSDFVTTASQRLARFGTQLSRAALPMYQIGRRKLARIVPFIGAGWAIKGIVDSSRNCRIVSAMKRMLNF